MAYQDQEWRRKLWDDFGVGLQSLKQQYEERMMSEARDVALDELVAWAAVVDDCIAFGSLPNAETMTNFKAAIAQAERVNTYLKGEQINDTHSNAEVKQ